MSTAASAFASETFSNYSISSSYTSPKAITVAGGSLWYGEFHSGAFDSIGNMTTSGVITDYNLGYPSGQTSFTINSLATGSDGNVWFNGRSGTSVYTGSLSISTGAVTFQPSSVVSSSSAPGSLTTGSDGNLWYYVKTAGSPSYTYLLRLNPSTGAETTMHTFTDTYASFTSLASGPDGNLWLTDSYNKRVLGIDVATGANLASYTMPTLGSVPGDITDGPDGNLWLIENGKIAKMTTGGVFTEYTVAAGVVPGTLTAGSDGAMWFIDYGTTPKIGRITSTGNVSEYTVPGSSVSGVGSLTLGPDGALWFTYRDGSPYYLGRIGY